MDLIKRFQFLCNLQQTLLNSSETHFTNIFTIPLSSGLKTIWTKLGKQLIAVTRAHIH